MHIQALLKSTDVLCLQEYWLFEFKLQGDASTAASGPNNSVTIRGRQSFTFLEHIDEKNKTGNGILGRTLIKGTKTIPTGLQILYKDTTIGTFEPISQIIRKVTMCAKAKTVPDHMQKLYESTVDTPDEEKAQYVKATSVRIF